VPKLREKSTKIPNSTKLDEYNLINLSDDVNSLTGEEINEKQMESKNKTGR
jgi:hypothetical protein